MDGHEKEASEKVMQLLTAAWVNQPLYVVTKLGIPDIFSDKPVAIDDLSQMTKSYTPFLYRVMRVLASVGFFHEEENRMFHITPLGELLKKDKMQPIVLMFLSEWHNHAWEKLYHSVKTGEIAFSSAHGKSCFEWFKEHEDEADIFNRANQIKAIAGHTEVTNLYNFSNMNSIVDVGGGYGGLLYHILKKNRHMRGTIADLPYMEEKVENQIFKNNLTGRCFFNKCDFFKKIPEGSDCYLLSNILHDWDDEKCKTILKNCRDAMKTDSKLLIIESVIPDGNGFSIGKLLDIEVLVMGGGKERTEVEFRRLFNQSGFNLNDVFITKVNISVLECSKS